MTTKTAMPSPKAAAPTITNMAPWGRLSTRLLVISALCGRRPPLAAAQGDTAGAKSYDARLAQTQHSVMTELWNGTFFRKWHKPDLGTNNENSFVSNQAGDWAARQAGLPRTLAPDIIHKSIAADNRPSHEAVLS